MAVALYRMICLLHVQLELSNAITFRLFNYGLGLNNCFFSLNLFVNW